MKEEAGDSGTATPVAVAGPDETHDWVSLPPELLEMIGCHLEDGKHVGRAAAVCKSWRHNVPAALSSLELDMHPNPAKWHAKLEALHAMLRRLSSCTIYISTKVPPALVTHNVALLRQLPTITDLSLRLTQGCELSAGCAGAIGGMPQLRSLSIVGGSLAPGCTGPMLQQLASCAPGLTRLTLLPESSSGLGDAEMHSLVANTNLEVLEFRAHRLTSEGFEVLSRLPRVERLYVCALDSDSGYELGCLERMPRLGDLNLALDHAAPGKSLCVLSPAQSLSLQFRWTERAAGLLQACQRQLANLTKLDMGACRVSNVAVFEAVAELTGLKELRMSVYSNTDHCVQCQLSRLGTLQKLQAFHLTKQHAYFPEHRRFAESSIVVPVTSATMRQLASRWCHLQSLRLALSRRDYSPEGLAALAAFTNLKHLGLSVERYSRSRAAAVAAAAAAAAAEATLPSANGMAAAAAAEGETDQHQEGVGVGSGGDSGGGGVSGSGGLGIALGGLGISLSSSDTGGGAGSTGEPGVASSSSGSSGSGGGSSSGGGSGSGGSGGSGGGSGSGVGMSLGRRSHDATAAAAAAAGGVCFQVVLDLDAHLPPGLESLELNNLCLELRQDSFLARGQRASCCALRSLDLENCLVRPRLLAALAARAAPQLTSLRLCNVTGLTDGALAALTVLTGLHTLVVMEESNPAVSQAGLASLAPLHGLKSLTWESRDLVALGPRLDALASFTGLRYLSLSCTRRTFVHALGSSRALSPYMPYALVALVQGTAPYRDDDNDEDEEEVVVDAMHQDQGQALGPQSEQQ